MAIPKLEVPTFELTLPSTNKKVVYRPFLVKEHKTLLMMKQSSDADIARIIEEIVDICTFKKLNLKNTAYFDIEYLFTNIRARSIGEKLDLIITCVACNHRNNHAVNLNEIKIEKSDDHKPKFMITDEIGIEMKYPRFSDYKTAIDNISEESMFDLIMKSVKAIYTKSGEYHEVSVDDKQDLQEFLEALTVQQYDKIEQFIRTMPAFKHNFSVKCGKCGHENKTVLEDIINFFV